MSLARVILKSGRDVSLRRGHPWIFSGAIKRVDGEKSAGELTQVLSAENEVLGVGYLSDEGSIAVKMLTFADEAIDGHFWQRKITQALQVRNALGLTRSNTTNAYRLIHAEGDGLPGLIVDVYSRLAVLQCQSLGMHLQKQAITEALRAVLGDSLEAIFDRSHSFESAKKSPQAGSFLWGSTDNQTIRENGYQFFVDWEKGQKTGFFLDQRENRQLVKEHSAGRHVLNAFSYTGGFSVYALGGGAEMVESVDSSQPALDILAKNVALNFEQAKHTEVADDFLHYMQSMQDRFDLIILDPPAFAKQRSAVPAALRGYRNVNARALEAIRKNGMLFTFSCSQLVSREDFRRTIFEAALQVKRHVRVIRELHQASCHPVDISHPEGDYLKGLMLYVE